MATTDLDLGRYQLGWSDAEDYVFKPKKGLNESIVREMSEMKGEPDWMRNFRLRSLKHFERKPMAPWFARRCRTSTSTTSTTTSSPPAGRWTSGRTSPTPSRTPTRSSASPRPSASTSPGVTAQYESEVVFHRNREDLEEQGVLFCDMDTAVREYPDIVRKWFGKIIPPNDNKFAALNSAVWSGGSFIYVPPGREGGHAAAGLLPDQRGEHGPVRADADHRRRGLAGALHRGLLGPGVLHRLAALGRGRAGRPARARGSPTRPSRTGRPTSTTW